METSRITAATTTTDHNDSVSTKRLRKMKDQNSLQNHLSAPGAALVIATSGSSTCDHPLTLSFILRCMKLEIVQLHETFPILDYIHPPLHPPLHPPRRHVRRRHVPHRRATPRRDEVVDRHLNSRVSQGGNGMQAMVPGSGLWWRLRTEG